MLCKMIKVENLLIDSGGRDRIRTYGGLPHTYFPSKQLKPLRHSSENELYKTNTREGSDFSFISDYYLLYNILNIDN